MLISRLIRDCAQNCFSSDLNQWATDEMTRLLFIAGQVALQHCLHLDSVERHYKRTLMVDDGQPPMDTAEIIRQVKEDELLYGERSLLRPFGQITAFVCLNYESFPDPGLQRTAALSLGKFMAVSQRYCQEHMPILQSLMAESKDPVQRGNAIVAFADICHAHSQVADSYVSCLFSRLSDPDQTVKRTAMMALTHLTLSGMIKVKKGELIGQIACLLDDDPNGDEQMRDLARMFFLELAGRDPHAYQNMLPDIISHVCQLPGDGSRILRFVFEHAKGKDRLMDGLLEKICLRFRVIDDPNQALMTAKSLNAMPWGSVTQAVGVKMAERLMDAWPLYQDRLCEQPVMEVFKEIHSKMARFYPNAGDERYSAWEAKLLSAA